VTPLALILAVAMTLSGEARNIGPAGYRAVADSILARREAGASWSETLSAYYAHGEPDADAMAVAAMAVLHPWHSMGMPYAVSRQDAARYGIVVDRWVCRGDWCVGLAREWAQ
jgi:hypothetical protein